MATLAATVAVLLLGADRGARLVFVHGIGTLAAPAPADAGGHAHEEAGGHGH